MCGIAGVIGENHQDSSMVHKMIQSLEHRGPDEQGFWLDNNVQLGMSRLAIIGIKDGQQPLANEDGTINVVCNGEIYNYLELKGDLERLGHTFKSHSDVEVIAHLYEEFGIDFITRLRGMFSIAVWDINNQKLILARDRLGKKPLYFTQSENGAIRFASEIKALRTTIEKPKVDFDAINTMLTLGYPLAPQTGFLGISMVPPATIAVWQAGVITSQVYWKLPKRKPTLISFDDAVDQLDVVLRDAVKLRMISERPIGAFLSGGVDSTLITAIMADLSPTKVSTFSIGFDQAEYDESKFASKIASYLGTEHRTEIAKPDPNFLFERIGQILDVPFADSSIIPTFLVSRMASDYVTVAMSGDGGDEAFGGYLRYRALPVLHRLNPALGLAGRLTNLVKNSSFTRKDSVSQRLSNALTKFPSPFLRYASLMTWIFENQSKAIWTREFAEKISGQNYLSKFEEIWNKVDASNLSDRAMRFDTQTYLPGDLNYKVDMSSMANSLEVRSPLMDQKVYEFAATLPISYHINMRENKILLKALLKRYVPAELTDRPKKGFGIPRAHWLRTELRLAMSELLLSEQTLERGWFEKATVEELVNIHLAGYDTDQILWPLMMVESWARNWLD